MFRFVLTRVLVTGLGVAALSGSLLAQATERVLYVSALDAKTKGKKDTTIFFQADKGVDYGDLMSVMDALRAAGYLKVGLVGLETAAKK